MAVRSLSVAVLLLESLAGLAWACALVLWPAVGTYVLPADLDPALIRTFLLADLAFFAAMPLAAAVGVHGARPWAWPLLCVHTGGVAYAAAWGWGMVGVRGIGWLGAVLMTAPAVAGFALVVLLRPREPRNG